MADSSGPTPIPDLVLGFIGNEEIERANISALLNELIFGHRLKYRNSQVRLIVPIEPFTQSTAVLAEYCLHAEHFLDLIGHTDAFNNPQVDHYRDRAKSLIRIGDPSVPLPVALVDRLAVYVNSRLILVGDPFDDDRAYLAFETATSKNIIVRSLLHGLDMVSFKTNETDEETITTEEQDPMARKSTDEEELDDDELDDDLEDDEDEDAEEGEEEEDEDDEEEGDDEELDEEEEEPDEEEEEEEFSLPDAQLTEAKLTRLAAKNPQRFKDAADFYGVTRGRGIRTPALVQGILEATGKIKKAKPASAKKAPPKPAAATRRTSTAKTKPTARRAASSSTAKRTSAPASNTDLAAALSAASKALALAAKAV